MDAAAADVGHHLIHFQQVFICKLKYLIFNYTVKKIKINKSLFYSSHVCVCYFFK